MRRWQDQASTWSIQEKQLFLTCGGKNEEEAETEARWGTPLTALEDKLLQPPRAGTRTLAHWLALLQLRVWHQSSSTFTSFHFYKSFVKFVSNNFFFLVKQFIPCCKTEVLKTHQSTKATFHLISNVSCSTSIHTQ